MYLLRFDRMTESQRQDPRIRLAMENARRTFRVSGESVPEDWRFALWFINDGSRTAENCNAVYLDETTPVRLLSLVRPDEAADVFARATGRSLLEEAQRRLRKDVLDSKSSLLVLADWLEENRFPEAALLRGFCAMPQGWSYYCMQ